MTPRVTYPRCFPFSAWLRTVERGDVARALRQAMPHRMAKNS